MTGVNQKEYLKKYLSLGSDPGKKKKHKKKSSISDRVKIIDDDIDIATFNQAVEEDLHGLNEDAPQIVGVIDDRPLELRIDDYRNTELWKPLGHESNNSTVQRSATRVQEDATSKSQKTNKKSNHSDDYSPLRKRNNSASNDYSPPRKSSDQGDSPRGKGNNDDNSPPRKRNNDNSPPRKSKSHKNEDLSPDRRRRRDSDKSPPRRTRSEDNQPRKNRRMSDDSPRRRQHYDEGPRRNFSRGNDRMHYRRDDVRRNDRGYDRYKGNRRNERYSETYGRNRKRYDDSPSRRRRNSRDRSSNRHGRRDSNRRSRSKDKEESTSSTRHRKSRWDDDQEQDKRPAFLDELIPKLLIRRKSGLQRANELLRANNFFQQNESDFLPKPAIEEAPPPVEPEGNVAPIVRDRQTGKIRDLKAEAEETKKKQEEEDETKAKYEKWGRGLKQVEDATERLNDQLHEMNKPLARYADDEDLEKHLKEVERDGDPMLAYLRKKKRKKDIETGKPMKPQFEGEFMPNRYGIKPGHRWDGVDRSNGYEKQWFEAMNSRRAQQEESYKWSTEDM